MSRKTKQFIKNQLECFFSILPIAIALIVMVNRLVYVSSEEQESKSKLDFDYCCVFTKLNQEQLQSKRKSVERVQIIGRTASTKFTSLVHIKGAATLAVTITFFLLALSYLGLMYVFVSISKCNWDIFWIRSQ